MTHRDHYLTLDGLRGVAALAVVLFHTGAQVQVSVAPVAYLAVDMFFVLSGFVIAHAYDRRLATGLSFLEFSRMRLKRLYPLYFAGLILGLGYSLVALRGAWPGAMDAGEILGTLAFGLLMLPTPGAASGGSILFPFNLPAWSLLFELLANAAYALGLARLGFRGLGAIVAVSAVGVVLGAFAFDHVTGGSSWEDAGGAFARVFFAFFAGVLLHRLLKGRPVRVANPAVLIALATLAVLLVVGRPSAWHDIILVIVIFPLLVAICTRIQPTGPLAAVCTWLGTTSYAVYVIHSPMLGWATLVIKHFNLDGYGPWASVILRMIPVLIAAVIADRYWDGPVRHWLSRRPRVSTA